MKSHASASARHGVVASRRDELVARLTKAGELEVLGGDQLELDT